jgi:putative hydrolase of the HAD superfamily
MQKIFKGIKNIIFDFGGVILNLDLQKSINEFVMLGVKDLDRMYLGISQHNVFDKLEKGQIEEQVFYDEVRSFIPHKVSNQEIANAWNAMLLDIPPQRISLLDKLNKNTEFRTFLLSNTNAIHYDHYVNNLTREYGFKDFSELFEKDYFSHKLGMKKPDGEIYDFVLKDAGLVPLETLFIDDSLPNLKGAEALGMKTFHLQAGMELTELFSFAPQLLCSNKPING